MAQTQAQLTQTQAPQALLFGQNELKDVGFDDLVLLGGEKRKRIQFEEVPKWAVRIEKAMEELSKQPSANVNVNLAQSYKWSHSGRVINAQAAIQMVTNGNSLV